LERVGEMERDRARGEKRVCTTYHKDETRALWKHMLRWGGERDVWLAGDGHLLCVHNFSLVCTGVLQYVGGVAMGGNQKGSALSAKKKNQIMAKGWRFL
jgi:hypothetical protein